MVEGSRGIRGLGAQSISSTGGLLGSEAPDPDEAPTEYGSTPRAGGACSLPTQLAPWAPMLRARPRWAEALRGLQGAAQVRAAVAGVAPFPLRACSPTSDVCAGSVVSMLETRAGSVASVDDPVGARSALEPLTQAHTPGLPSFLEPSGGASDSLSAATVEADSGVPSREPRPPAGTHAGGDTSALPPGSHAQSQAWHPAAAAVRGTATQRVRAAGPLDGREAFQAGHSTEQTPAQRSPEAPGPSAYPGALHLLPHCRWGQLHSLQLRPSAQGDGDGADSIIPAPVHAPVKSQAGV